jgi:hypothetical protein
MSDDLRRVETDAVPYVCASKFTKPLLDPKPAGTYFTKNRENQ